MEKPYTTCETAVESRYYFSAFFMGVIPETKTDLLPSMIFSKIQRTRLIRSVIIALSAMDPREIVIDAQRAAGIVGGIWSLGLAFWNHSILTG